MLDHSKTGDVNLSVLQRRDSTVVAIVASTAHVAVYEYDGSWKRKDVEGSLFIVERYHFMSQHVHSRVAPSSGLASVEPSLAAAQSFSSSPTASALVLGCTCRRVQPRPAVAHQAYLHCALCDAFVVGRSRAVGSCAHACWCGCGMCRSAVPQYQIVVLNRLNPKDLVVDISPSLQFKDQEGYLMFSIDKRWVVVAVAHWFS